MKQQIGYLLSKLIYEANPFKKARSRRFYAEFIGNNDLCFDVGAHMGDRSVTWIHLGAKVVGIEPQPRFSKYLQSKFKGNKNYFMKS